MDNTTENKFVFIEHKKSESEKIVSPAYSYWKSVFRKFFSSKMTIFMLCLATFIVLMSFIQPLISGYDHFDTPNINNFDTHFIRPGSQYIFGTDNFGRSLFNSLWAGTKMSLEISLIACAIQMFIGVIVGAFWGYSKKIDIFMLELYNIIVNVPFLLVAMVIMYVLGPGKWQLIFALSCTSWLGIGYFIRVQVMIIRDREYNMASRCLGTPTKKIITHNVLPHLISVIVTLISRTVPMLISYEVFLSFLGIGVGSSQVSLGKLIQEYVVFMDSAGYLFWIPVVVSAMISVSLYIVGQSLADASDPKTHMV